MDKPETRKEVAHEDRADPDTGGGFYLGKNAVDLLRRALWGAAGVAFVGILLAGAGVWLLRDILAALIDIAIALKGR